MKKNQLIKVATFLLPILFFSLWSFGQAITISGTINDESGTPLPGATIQVKGSMEGTITDVNGNYSINVPGPGSI